MPFRSWLQFIFITAATTWLIIGATRAPYLHNPPESYLFDICSPAQFYYGTQLIVSPVISPRDPFTRVARKCTYLPSGMWFNYHTGVAIEGDRFQVDYCGIEEIPVYAKVRPPNEYL
jgi:alpha-glucosidase (family GH31 glycosyl hydrolase)